MFPGEHRLLVVDDAVDSGVTLATVIDLLRNTCPDRTEIRSAVITVTLEVPAPNRTMPCITACCADFPGRLMPRVDPVLVFDLDGTLLTVNSFPIWVLFLGSGGVRGLSPGRTASS